MRRLLNEGDEFTVNGTLHVVLRSQTKWAYCLAPDGMRFAKVQVSWAAQKRTGRRWVNLISAIRRAACDLRAGAEIHVDDQTLTFEGFRRNTSLIASDQNGDHYQIPFWAPWWVDRIPAEALQEPRGTNSEEEQPHRFAAENTISELAEGIAQRFEERHNARGFAKRCHGS